MILIGQLDSPFVRRVAIAMARYGLPFEQKPWSVWREAEDIAPFNPLRRVPVLVLDDGEVLIESGAILDHLDEQVEPARAMLARSGRLRREGLRLCALATGLADKAISLLYERVLRDPASRSRIWERRCAQQIRDTLAVLEADRARRTTRWWLGDALGHPDVAVACALRFVAEGHPGAWDSGTTPALAGHAARCEALPEFQRLVQPLTVAVDERA
jgi:glutathione S-transferase